MSQNGYTEMCPSMSVLHQLTPPPRSPGMVDGCHRIPKPIEKAVVPSVRPSMQEVMACQQKKSRNLMTTVVAAVPFGFMPGVTEGLLEPAAALQAE